MTSGAAQANAHTRLVWCDSRQLTLSNPKGPHRIFAQAESSYWFVQIRNHGASTCLTGAWLTLSSVRGVNGARVQVRGLPVPGGLGGGNPRTFALRPHARAFVLLESGFPTTAAESRTCKARVLLSFRLPHRGGSLAVRVPRDAGVLCPRKTLVISATYDAAAFFQFMQAFVAAAPSR
jgi:hypothetical protein